MDASQIRQRLNRSSKMSGYNSWLDFDIDDLQQGIVQLTLKVRPDMTQHHGFVHGGVVAGFADLASAWAGATVAGDVVTSSFNIQYLAPAIGDSLTVDARVLKKGKRNVSVETKVFTVSDGTKKLCAAAMAAIAILDVTATAA